MGIRNPSHIPNLLKEDSAMRVAKIVMIAMAAMGVAGSGGTPASKAAEPKAEKATLRVGVFDSRAVAVAYAGSQEFDAQLKRLMEEHQKAKAAGDTEKVKQLEAQGRQSQDQLHQQGFSTGSVANILEKIKDQLPGIAKEAGVDLIVSKWDVPYQVPGSQTVDVTQAMIKPFHPSEKTLRMIQGLEKVQPIPLEEAKKIPTRE
jgi:hypothetical protein